MDPIDDSLADLVFSTKNKILFKICQPNERNYQFQKTMGSKRSSGKSSGLGLPDYLKISRSLTQTET